MNQHKSDDALKGQELARLRRRFEQDINLWSIWTVLLAALTGYWALQGDRLMQPVFAVFLVCASLTWGWRYRRATRTDDVSAVSTDRARLSLSEKSFGYGWAVAVALGGFAYIAGFVPATPLYLVMAAAGLLWLAIFLLVVPFFPNDFKARWPQWVGMAMAIFISCGAGTGYGFGWYYTQRYGTSRFEVDRVVEKGETHWRSHGDHWYVQLDVDGWLSNKHDVSQAQWQQLAIGSTVPVQQVTSQWGSIVTIDWKPPGASSSGSLKRLVG